MFRVFAALLLTCLITSTGLAQSKFDGKWATDRPDRLNSENERPKGSPLDIEITLDAEKASGRLTIGGPGGEVHTFKDAKLNGNRFRFEIVSSGVRSVWTVDLIDESTIRLSHTLPLVGANVLDLLDVLPATPPSAVGASAGSPGEWVGIPSILHRTRAVADPR